jgi:hypothetical protein
VIGVACSVLSACLDGRKPSLQAELLTPASNMLLAPLVALVAALQALAAPHIQKRDHSHLAKRNFGRVTFFRSTDSDPNLACQGYYYS